MELIEDMATIPWQRDCERREKRQTEKHFGDRVLAAELWEHAGFATSQRDPAKRMVRTQKLDTPVQKNSNGRQPNALSTNAQRFPLE
jgi:hypothetical protein